jgi:hypothetical protein
MHSSLRKLLCVICLAGITLSARADWHINVLWDRSGRVDSAAYGMEILPMGDQNNDGFADWAVVAYGEWRNGIGRVSYAEFFHGGNSPDTVPYRAYNTDSTMWDVFASGVGDVNGDSYQDWLTWTRYRNDPQTYVIRLYYGGATADTTPQATLHLTTDESIYGMGDFNGDGYDDLYRYDHTNDIGEIYFGGVELDTLPGWVIHADHAHGIYPAPDGFGDINGDSIVDVMCASPAGAIDIFWGSANPDTIPGLEDDSLQYAWRREVVNDLNGDGRAELAFSGTQGCYIHLGGQTVSPIPSYTLNFSGGQGPDHLLGIGSVNGDRYGDCVGLDYAANNGWGRLALYLGNYQLSPNPVLVIDGRTAPLNLVGI